MAAQKQSTLIEREPLEVIPVREVKVLYSWNAPTRLFKRRTREFWTTVGSMAFLLGVILLLIEEWLLILVIVSLIFVYYVFSTIPPEEIPNQISNRGVRFADRQYLWDQLDRFWITEKWGKKIINFGLSFGMMRSFRLLATENEAKEIQTILKKYLPEEPLPPSFSDNAAEWLAKKIPLEIS